MKTKSFILVSVAVLAALVGGFLYIAVSGDGEERRAGALVRSYAAGNFSLEIAGTNVGYLKSVSGCGVSAKVVGLATGDKEGFGKTTGPVNYGPCQVAFGTGMKPQLYSWISDSLSGKGGPKNVSILVSDATNKAVTRLDLTDTYLRRFTMPALEAGNKEALYFELTLEPDSIRKTTGGTATAGLGPKSTKSFMLGNFRLNAPGLPNDARKANKVESWSFEMSPSGGEEVRRLTYQAELGNLTVMVPEPAADFEAWLDGLMTGNRTEKEITVELLDSTLKDVLVELRFTGAGLISGELLGAGTTGSEAVARREFSMYVEGASIRFNAGAVG